jgi:hypothetical protein
MMLAQLANAAASLVNLLIMIASLVGGATVLNNSAIMAANVANNANADAWYQFNNVTSVLFPVCCESQPTVQEAVAHCWMLYLVHTSSEKRIGNVTILTQTAPRAACNSGSAAFQHGALRSSDCMTSMVGSVLFAVRCAREVHSEELQREALL